MRDPRLDKLADVLVQHCAPVRQGDLVVIRGEPASMPAVEATFEAVLRAGGHPSFHARSDSLREILIRHGNDEQITHTCPFETHRLSNCDVMIVLDQPVNTRYMGRMDPAKVARAQQARRAGLSSVSIPGLASKRQGYVLTEIPGQAAAQDAEMSLTDYADWVFRAGFLHLPDPLAAWRKIQDQQERVCSHLEKKCTLLFQSPAADGTNGSRKHDGTKLTIDVSGRHWLNRCGGENFPDGEVDGGPRSIDGVVNFTWPAVYRGKEVDGIRLQFRDGRVVDASATKNEPYLHALLAVDEGSAVAGEIGIGCNYHITDFSRNAFFDEKIGGTFHLGMGAGYHQTGNTNQSAIHWDMVSDLRQGGTIHADGELIQENGAFAFADWPTIGFK